MIFELSDSLIDDLLFAMENQNDILMVDSKKGCLITEDELGNQEFDEDSDGEDFYDIPQWNSADGYSLLENFTNNLHAPLARQELKRVLTGGRGVFRNFKDVLKLYPEVEKQFYYYKTKVMKERIYEWYNQLRSVWNLESIEHNFSGEDTQDLLLEDFKFVRYEYDVHYDAVKNTAVEMENEYKEQYSGELGEAVGLLVKNQLSIYDFKNKTGFVCFTQNNEFVGAALTCNFPENAKRTAVITELFVTKEFRGLGIGKKLLEECLILLKSSGLKHLIVPNAFIPKSMESLLAQFEFEKIGSGFVADLLKE